MGPRPPLRLLRFVNGMDVGQPMSLYPCLQTTCLQKSCTLYRMHACGSFVISPATMHVSQSYSPNGGSRARTQASRQDGTQETPSFAQCRGITRRFPECRINRAYEGSNAMSHIAWAVASISSLYILYIADSLHDRLAHTVVPSYEQQLVRVAKGNVSSRTMAAARLLVKLYY